jgi:hypothetical protein
MIVAKTMLIRLLNTKESEEQEIRSHKEIMYAHVVRLI